MYCMHAIPLHNSGETHKLQPDLPGHTYAESDCQSALLNHSPGNAASICRKRYFFKIPFPSVCLLVCRHHPPSADFNYPSLPQKWSSQSKEEENLLFSPPHPPSSSFHVSAENKGKVEKVCWQFIRRSEQSGEGGVWNGKMVRCQSIIIQNSSPAPITSTTDNRSNKQTIFLRSFSDEKVTLPIKGKAPLMQIRLPYLPLTSTELRKNL